MKKKKNSILLGISVRIEIALPTSLMRMSHFYMLK